MRVRMLTTVAGTRGKDDEVYVYEAGAEYDVDAKEAKDLCARPDGSPRAEPVAQRAVERAEKR